MPSPSVGSLPGSVLIISYLFRVERVLFALAVCLCDFFQSQGRGVLTSMNLEDMSEPTLAKRASNVVGLIVDFIATISFFFIEGSAPPRMSTGCHGLLKLEYYIDLEALYNHYC